MSEIERGNPSLKGVLPKDYARPGLDKQQLINLVSDIGLGSPADRAKDVLGRVYEYFLAQFASAEGKKGGQFYTRASFVCLNDIGHVPGNSLSSHCSFAYSALTSFRIGQDRSTTGGRIVRP